MVSSIGIFLCSCSPDKSNISEKHTVTTYDEIRDEKGLKVINFTDEDGNRQGPWIEDHIAGIHHMRKNMFYKNNMLDSIYREIYDNVIDITGHYKMGKRNGEWKYIMGMDTAVEFFKDDFLIKDLPK